MKKIFFCSLIIAAIFSACKKDETHIFSQSPDERLNQTLANYQSRLSGAQFGWKAVIYPKGGGAYSFYFKFNDANRVQMVSDFDSASAVTLKESSYRLKALQQPSLIFDTYSYVSLLSDPDGSVNGGSDGVGLLSDFEFYFNGDSTSADTLNLTGRVNGSKAVLVRATQDEANLYTNGGFNISLFKGYLGKILQYFKRLTIGTTLYDVTIDMITKTILFTWVDGQGNIQTFSTAFYFTADGGIAFQNPFSDGTNTITGLSNPTFSGTTITVTAGGGPATITGVNSPIAVDKAAPQRWWQYAVTNGTYWISIQGFHVNGVDNAFRIDTLDNPNYYYLIYWPKYATSNDLFAPVFIDSAGTGLTLLYGAAPAPPTFTADGRARFTLLGTYGTYPTTGGAALTLTQLLQTSGYYFVQTSATTYDMVSVADAKTWLTWIF